MKGCSGKHVALCSNDNNVESIKWVSDPLRKIQSTKVEVAAVVGAAVVAAAVVAAIAADVVAAVVVAAVVVAPVVVADIADAVVVAAVVFAVVAAAMSPLCLEACLACKNRCVDYHEERHKDGVVQ